MSRLRLSPSASVTPTPAGVMLCSDLGTFQITGTDVRTFVERIVPLCDGTRDRAAILAALPGYTPRSVEALLDLLEKRGLLEAIDDAAPSAGERWRGQDDLLRRWPGSGPGLPPMDRLRNGHVVIAGLEPWGAAAAHALADAGVGTLRLLDDRAERRDGTAKILRARAPWSRVEPGALGALDAEARADLVVVAVAPAETARVERIARFSQRAGVRCLWSHLTADAAFLGPLTVPGRTACRICAAADALGPNIQGRGPAGTPEMRRMAEMLGHLVALEAIKLIAAYTPPILAGRMLLVDAATLETTLHTLVRVPWCAVCGAAARAAS